MKIYDFLCAFSLHNSLSASTGMFPPVQLTVFSPEILEILLSVALSQQLQAALIDPPNEAAWCCCFCCS